MFAIRVEYTRWAGQAEESAPQARRPRGRRPLTSMIVDLPSTRFSTFGCGERCTPSLTSLLYASDDSSKYAVVESASPLASASLPQEALRGCCPCAFAIRSPTRRRSSATAAQLPQLTHTQSILSLLAVCCYRWFPSFSGLPCQKSGCSLAIHRARSRLGPSARTTEPSKGNWLPDFPRHRDFYLRSRFFAVVQDGRQACGRRALLVFARSLRVLQRVGPSDGTSWPAHPRHLICMTGVPLLTSPNLCFCFAARARPASCARARTALCG